MVVNQTTPLTIVAYTDGAARSNPGVAGWGALIVMGENTRLEICGHSPHATNNQMELMAALQTLYQTPEDAILHIYTDSTYLKDGMTLWMPEWKKKHWKKKTPIKNLELWQALDLAASGRVVEWHWVRGHNGDAGNERADALANMGADGIEKGNFVAPKTISARGVDKTESKSQGFDGDTSRKNPSFVPLLPKPTKTQGHRQLVMDTETTGLHVAKGDRIVEIGAVELIDRKFTGKKLHVYLNPRRKMDDEVIAIHGISNTFVADMPEFAQVAQTVYDFFLGAELIAHNASFDMEFLDFEFANVGLGDFQDKVQITDTLILARDQFPAQKNNLDALVRRLNIPERDRTFHGALLDSEILADVYLAMTGGQIKLHLSGSQEQSTREHKQFEHLAHLLHVAP